MGRGAWGVGASVEIVSEVGVPMTMVRAGKDRRKSGVEIWLVFDRDDHPNWRSALVEARDAGLHVADSNPCFELYGLLLYEEHTAYLSTGQAQSRLKQLDADYDHARRPVLRFDDVRGAVEVAHGRACTLVERAENHHDDAHENPSTRVHLLVARLKELAGRAG